MGGVWVGGGWMGRGQGVWKVGWRAVGGSGGVAAVEERGLGLERYIELGDVCL